MPRRLVPIVVAFVVGVVVASGVAYGANPFVDVAGNSHEANIDAIYNAGITTGCDTTHYCPNNNVTRAQMATFLARLGGLGDNFPKTNAKGPTQAYCAIAEANAGAFPLGPCATSVTTPDATDDAGRYSKIAIGSDGLPVVAYATRNGGGDFLRFLHCGNEACTSGNASRTIDAGTSSGFFPSIAIGTDGLPIISYYDNGSFDLKVVHCGTALCDAGNVTTPLDTAGTVGALGSIAIGADDLPVISYYDQTNGNLKVAHCVDVTCAVAGTALTTLDNVGDVGSWTSIAIVSGAPVISYYDTTNTNLKVARCTNAACIGGNTFTTVDNTTDRDVGRYNDITIGSDGLPVVVYADIVGEAEGTLKLAHCTNEACTASTLTTVEPGMISGLYASIAIASDGFPILTYLFTGTSFADIRTDLRVAHCATVTCTGATRFTDVDKPTDSGFFSSVAIGVDGDPVVSYQGGSDLKVARVPTA
jgi:hypothetical protein